MGFDGEHRTLIGLPVYHLDLALKFAPEPTEQDVVHEHQRDSPHVFVVIAVVRRNVVVGTGMEAGLRAGARHRRFLYYSKYPST